MKTQEIELINNRKMIIEIDRKDNTESLKTYIIGANGEVEANSVRITCTCNGQSVTQTCAKDGYCDCSGRTPRVKCTN